MNILSFTCCSFYKPLNLRLSVIIAAILYLALMISLLSVDQMKYKDPNLSIDARVEDLLSRMTLEEKIGQMLQVERKHTSADLVNKYFIGSVMSEGGSIPAPQASAETWVDMVNEFQKGALSTRLGIPVFYGVDAVHGHNTVYNATIFPHNIGLGATRDPELVKRIGAATALEVRATGVQYAYAPCIAVCRDPRWGRCYESYSEDTELVQAMTEIIPGLQGDIPHNLPKGVPFISGKEKVIGSAKHYVGDGGTIDGINEHNTVIDRDGLMKIHMPPYLTSIDKGVASIMVSYSSWNGVKMHAHHDLITAFLKNTLHFKGFVISDFEGIDRITTPHRANINYSIEAGVSAGIDMFMFPKLYTEFIDGLSMLVKNERIPMSRIDDAVRRILWVKFMMGLFENPYADYSMTKYLGIQEHRNLAREAVRKSMVLLKNGQSVDKPLLPLPKKAPKILVAGIHADNLGYQCGGWTIEWQGVSGNNLLKGTTILNAVKNTVDPETTVIYKENPDAEFVKSNEFSYAIVVVGEPPYAETHGDNMNLTIPDPGPEMIRNVCGVTKCVVIVISGRPLVIEPYVDMIDALVAAWLPGSEGQGVADVLFGDYAFTGKLPRTWFKSVDQLPMNVGDPHYDPLFPFGFGLSTQTTEALFSE
ncbi:beta-glucosidase BoGH3B-like isoform X1 [Vigna umbellata]|uniref:beta-glucosidase BoGH3B-like isoform X1 n=1 Tax=Vigna umbellata TaxID=87088 RepID=UPI001F5EEC69|nr:beta-glucosidase BoGH3B-like isoform X1 [Vigna umbellata]